MRRGFTVLTAVLGLALNPWPALAQDATSELMASMTRLERLKTYRARTTVTPGPQYAAQLAQMQQMGMGELFKPILQEVVNPDVRRSVQQLRIPAMGSGQLRWLDARLIAVIRGSTLATYLDSPELERETDEMVKRQLETQAAALVSNAVSAVATAALGGPVGILSAGMQLGAAAAQTGMTHAGVERGKQHVSLNRWTCRRVEALAGDRASPPIKNARLLGTGQTGDRAARIYEFSITDAGTGAAMPIKAFVATDSGLPVRLEATTSEGGMVMEYYDFDAPITIALPDCMK